jgi:hypothetical protein
MDHNASAPRAPHSPAKDRLIWPNEGADWSGLNSKPFLFHHRLADHPLFEIPRLVELVDKVLGRGDDRKYAVYGDASIAALPPKERLKQALLRIQEGTTWLKLSSLHELDPAYAALLDDLLRDMEDLSHEPIRRFATWRAMTVFIASPNKVTPYHIDHDTNFLLQVKGAKKVYLFDQSDRSLLTEDEIERFYLGNPAAARFSDDVMAKAHCFDLAPGDAVHHPPLAPHLVRNGDNVSVSVSFFYSSPDLDYRSKIYQANGLLRRAGLHPSPPRGSGWVDKLKAGALSAFSDRNPQTQDDILYSGLNRLMRPMRSLRRLSGRTPEH